MGEEEIGKEEILEKIEEVRKELQELKKLRRKGGGHELA